MLIQITNSCSMQCPHCLQDSVSSEAHMKGIILNKALGLASRLGCNILSISGGEFTEHPEFYNLIKAANSAYVLLHGPFWEGVLESNGLFLGDKEKTEKVLELLETTKFKTLQITSVKGTYPKYDKVKYYFNKALSRARFRELVREGRIYFVEQIERMDDIGRAQKSSKYHQIASEKPYLPTCINMALTSRQLQDFRQVVNFLESNGKVCSPFVDYTGIVHMGESIFCHQIGSVDDSIEDLYDKLVHSKLCGNCGVTYENYKKLINKENPSARDSLIKQLLENE